MAIRETGKVNENLEPLVVVQFSNGSEIECVIDTVFNGELFLPSTFIEQNEFKMIGQESFNSVGQAEPHVADVFSAEMNWLGESTEVGIIASEHGSALIGSGMMTGARLENDYVAASVIIERIY